ncbi:hypothetical protein LTS18_008733, partial [Coniosporium uncinatum]
DAASSIEVVRGDPAVSMSRSTVRFDPNVVSAPMDRVQLSERHPQSYYRPRSPAEEFDHYDIGRQAQATRFVQCYGSRDANSYVRDVDADASQQFRNTGRTKADAHQTFLDEQEAFSRLQAAPSRDQYSRFRVIQVTQAFEEHQLAKASHKAPFPEPMSTDQFMRGADGSHVHMPLDTPFPPEMSPSYPLRGMDWTVATPDPMAGMTYRLPEPEVSCHTYSGAMMPQPRSTIHSLPDAMMYAQRSLPSDTYQSPWPNARPAQELAEYDLDYPPDDQDILLPQYRPPPDDDNEDDDENSTRQFQP